MTLRRLAYLAALAAVALARTAPAEEPAVKLAHIKLSGEFTEAPGSVDDPFSPGPHENFKAKLERIRKARTDKAVSGLYLEIDDVAAGWAQLDELCKALAEFRASGKKAFAYLESGDAKDYLLGLACDEVCMPEGGWLMLTGLRAEVTFYKDLFDKLGIKADFLQMGDFKGAAEPYTRNKLSEANRKQLQSILDDRFEHGIVERLVRSRPGRKWTSEQVQQLIDEGPYSARAALAAGLIDRIGYVDEYRAALKKAFKSGKVEVVKDYAQQKSEEIDFGNPFAVLKALFNSPKGKSSDKPKLALVYAIGAITTGKSGRGLMEESMGSTTMIEAIRKAEEDDTVKAIVLRVDSPGGSALASDLIWNELRRCKKPVVASMGDVAASGGYYISMAARKIYADPGTITGSIGVIGGKLTLGGLYDKVGLKTEVLQRGANAGLFSSEECFTPSQREALRVLMQDTYDQFLDKALAGRKRAGKQMSRDQLKALAGGRVWTGRQAKENGLIDELGGLQDAIAAAKQMAGLPADKDPELLILPQPKSFLDTLLEGKVESSIALRGLRDAKALRRHLRTVSGLLQLRGEPVWLALPYGIDLR
jgi:protease-4